MTGTDLNAQKICNFYRKISKNLKGDVRLLTFQRKQKQLIEPISQSIQKAILDVAQENNNMFILNAGAGQRDLVLHADATSDVSDLILKKLGIKSVN